MRDTTRRPGAYADPPHRRHRRRRPHLVVYFFAAIGFITTLVLLARYAVVPLLVYLQQFGGSA